MSAPGVLTVRLKRPHPAQQRVLRESKAAGSRYHVVCCGRRWGKTAMGLILAALPALEGHPVGWFAPDYKAQQELWRETKRALGPAIKEANQSTWRMDLVTGGSIAFWSLDHDPEACRGNHYKRVLIDEAAKVRHLEVAWTQAIRATLIDLEGDAWFLSTPRGRDYFFKLYSHGVEGDEDFRPDWRSWRMPTEANPHIPAHEVAKMRAEMDPQVVAQEIDAEFLEGGEFFRQYSEVRHTLLPHDIPEGWRWYGGFDWGSTAPACFLLGGFDWNGVCTVTDEIYAAGKTDNELAAEVASLMRARGLDPRQIVVAADPSMWSHINDRGGYGERRVEAYLAAGLRFVKADNSREDGWANVRDYFHQDKLRIFRGRCAALIRTIPLQLSKRGNVEDIDTTREDHAVDALRYLLAQRPLSAKPTPEMVRERLDREAQESVAKAQREKYLFRPPKREKVRDF